MAKTNKWKVSFTVGKKRKVSPATFKNKAAAKTAVKRALALRSKHGYLSKNYQIKNPRVTRQK